MAWCNLQVKLCDPCLRALEVVTTMHYRNRRILYFTSTYTPLIFRCNACNEKNLTDGATNDEH